MKKPAAAARDPELPFPSRKPPTRVTPQDRFSPETIARNAIARRPTTPAGNVKYAVTLFLRRELAEALTVRALREGKNTPVLIAELLDVAMRRAG